MSRSLRVTAEPVVPARPPAGPLEVRRPHPDAWAWALREAGGDASRCRTQPDGSVLVRNPR